MNDYSVTETTSKLFLTCATEAVRQLSSASVPNAVLAELIEVKSMLGFLKHKTFKPLARVWPLGVLLVDTDARLYTTNQVTRATDPKHPGYQSVSQEQRRELKAIAFASKIAEGETVYFDSLAVPVQLGAVIPDHFPFFCAEDTILVKWNPNCLEQDAVPLKSYLQQRVELAIEKRALRILAGSREFVGSSQRGIHTQGTRASHSLKCDNQE